MRTSRNWGQLHLGLASTHQRHQTRAQRLQCRELLWYWNTTRLDSHGWHRTTAGLFSETDRRRRSFSPARLGPRISWFRSKMSSFWRCLDSATHNLLDCSSDGNDMISRPWPSLLSRMCPWGRSTFSLTCARSAILRIPTFWAAKAKKWTFNSCCSWSQFSFFSSSGNWARFIATSRGRLLLPGTSWRTTNHRERRKAWKSKAQIGGLGQEPYSPNQVRDWIIVVARQVSKGHCSGRFSFAER